MRAVVSGLFVGLLDQAVGRSRRLHWTPSPRAVFRSHIDDLYLVLERAADTDPRRAEVEPSRGLQHRLQKSVGKRMKDSKKMNQVHHCYRD